MKMTRYQNIAGRETAESERDYRFILYKDYRIVYLLLSLTAELSFPPQTKITLFQIIFIGVNTDQKQAAVTIILQQVGCLPIPIALYCIQLEDHSLMPMQCQSNILQM